MSASVFSVIICKLNYQKEFSPIVLIEVDKDLEINFNNSVLSFDLIVGKNMENGGKFLLDA